MPGKLCRGAVKGKHAYILLTPDIARLSLCLDVCACSEGDAGGPVQVKLGWCLQGSEVEDPDTPMTRKPDDKEPFSGLAFKIMADPFVGTLTFVRIYRCGPDATMACI